MAERPDVSATADSLRRSLNKWRNGEPMGARYGRILEEMLGLEDGALDEPNYSKAVAAVAEVIRRLEAGESLPSEHLEAVALAAELAGEGALLLADRLRREALARGLL
jgi:hypothetical protein